MNVNGRWPIRKGYDDFITGANTVALLNLRSHCQSLANMYIYLPESFV